MATKKSAGAKKRTGAKKSAAAKTRGRAQIQLRLNKDQSEAIRNCLEKGTLTLKLESVTALKPGSTARIPVGAYAWD